MNLILAAGVVLPGWAYLAIGIPVVIITVASGIKAFKEAQKRKAKKTRR